MSDDVRRAAAATVAEIADRLSDPDAVVAVTESSGDDGVHVDVDGVESVLWTPGSLNDGYPAVALLHAELGRFDDRFRTIAHRYLELAAKQDRFQPSGELDGPCAVAIAMRAAAQDPGDYATPLGRLDEHVIGNAHWLIAMQQAAHRNREPTRPVVIDTLTGLAGLGRHLLARAPVNPDAATAVREVLIWLSALREPIEWHGTTVPGWWYHKTALLGTEDDAAAFEWGSATLGLSHGIAGPMALLGYAWQADYRVPGQDDALRTMAEWLLDWLHPDGYWPMHVPLTHYRNRGVDPPPSSLVGWCHGTWASRTPWRSRTGQTGLDRSRRRGRPPGPEALRTRVERRAGQQPLPRLGGSAVSTVPVRLGRPGTGSRTSRR